jgi:uncharacterized damage-inducible protein DinB
MTIDDLRLHLAYNAWATRLLLEAASKLSPPELNRDFQTSDRSVLDTLVHVLAGDRIWCNRVRGVPYTSFTEPEDRSIEALISRFGHVHQSWKTLLEEETSESIERLIAYHDLKGNPRETPLWQIVLHVVNHGSHHRGQVSGFLRAMGYTPPPLDLIYFYRTLAAAANA